MGLKRRTINGVGLMACLGAGVGVSADPLTGWSSESISMNSAVSLDIDSIRSICVGKPRWTFVLGNHLAVFWPFHMLGFFLVYQAIVPAGPRTATAFLGGRSTSSRWELDIRALSRSSAIPCSPRMLPYSTRWSATGRSKAYLW